MVGVVVSFYSDIIRVGRTSLTVRVVVYAERLTKLCNNVAKITEAELVYVALGPDKKPIDLEESRAQFAQCCSLETGWRGFLFLNGREAPRDVTRFSAFCGFSPCPCPPGRR